MVVTSLDFDRHGKQHGFLQVPYSHNLSGWANVLVPITVVAHGQRPGYWCWQATMATNTRDKSP